LERTLRVRFRARRWRGYTVAGTSRSLSDEEARSSPPRSDTAGLSVRAARHYLAELEEARHEESTSDSEEAPSERDAAMVVRSSEDEITTPPEPTAWVKVSPERAIECDQPSALAFLHDGRLAVATDESVFVYHPTSATQVVLDAANSQDPALASSPDGRLLAYAAGPEYEQDIVVWSSVHCREEWRARSPVGHVSSAAFSPRRSTPGLGSR
jgi:glucose/arabinose dehydrogenase